MSAPFKSADNDENGQGKGKRVSGLRVVPANDKENAGSQLRGSGLEDGRQNNVDLNDTMNKHLSVSVSFERDKSFGNDERSELHSK